jgi:hypothetical protein
LGVFTFNHEEISAGIEPSSQLRGIFVAKGVNQLITGMDLVLSITKHSTCE